MKTLITPEAMRKLEADYFREKNVLSIDLMERAAAAYSAAIEEKFGRGRAYFVCGAGGNGGDGLAAARLHVSRGIPAEIILAAEPKTADAIENLRRAVEAGVPVHAAGELDSLPEPDVWGDAIFGIGLTRAPEGAIAQLISRMNASPAPVAAADIPSGLDARTGRAFDPCVRADLTVSFQHAKTGHCLADGFDVCGEVRAVDIGITDDIPVAESVKMIEPSDLKKLLKKRPRNMHKGTAGHLLIVAGSFGMAGAAAIAASAALRTGAGLVSIACPVSIVPILQTLAPCAMCIPLPESEGALSADGAEMLKSAIAGKSAVAVGCGLSRRAAPEILRAVLESKIPAVIDADGLNILSENADLRALLHENVILTPHPGEAARLLGEFPADPVSAAAKLHAETGATVALKGTATVIAGSDLYLSASGTSGMARGGSGDALTGVTGALLAEGINAPADRRIERTAALACQIHGLAGEAAAKRHTARAMTAMHLVEGLEEVFRQYGE